MKCKRRLEHVNGRQLDRVGAGTVTYSSLSLAIAQEDRRVAKGKDNATEHSRLISVLTG